MENVNTNPFIKKLLLVVLVITLLSLLYFGIIYFLLIFTGILLAILWRGLSQSIVKKTSFSYRVVLPIIIGLHLLSLALFVWLAYPVISAELKAFGEEIPKIMYKVERTLQESALGRVFLEATESEDPNESRFEISKYQLETVLQASFNFGVHVALLIAFTFFILADPKFYVRGALRLVPKQHQEYARSIMHDLAHVLYRWFVGKIIDMSSIFVMTLIGLALLGVPHVLLLALIAFFFSFIPNIGPIISALPAMAIALLVSPDKALYVGLMYLGIQLLESYFITPAVQQKASYAPPLLLLLVQFLFAEFMGVLGLFLATPILVTLMLIVRRLYVERTLGNYSPVDQLTQDHQ